MVGIPALNPLRWSNEFVSNHVQKTIPLGTDINETVRKLEKHWKWEIKNVRDYGVLLGRGSPSRGSPEIHKNSKDKFIGEKSIEVSLGWYQDILFGRYVNAFFIFDENDKLIDVVVWKESGAR